MAEKYVRCGSHCKYPAYDKEEVDALLEKKIDATEIYTKGNFVIVEHEFITESEYQSISHTAIPYPEGFNMNNTFILNARYFDGTMYITQNVTVLEGPAYQDTMWYSLRDHNIVLSGRLPRYEVGTTIKLQALIMKVE